MTKDESDLEARYLGYPAIGAGRALQQVPLNQFVWAIVLTKENLWNFIRQEIPIERPVEVFGEMEMLQRLNQFFDRAIYYATIGYKLAAAERAIPQITAAGKIR